MTADRFYVRRFGVITPTSPPVVLADSRGRRREWGSVAGAVRALRAAGENLADWQVMRGHDSGAGFFVWSAAGAAADYRAGES